MYDAVLYQHCENIYLYSFYTLRQDEEKKSKLRKGKSLEIKKKFKQSLTFFIS